jgi:hypothetical protein
LAAGATSGRPRSMQPCTAAQHPSRRTHHGENFTALVVRRGKIIAWKKASATYPANAQQLQPCGENSSRAVSSVPCEAFTGWPCALQNLSLLLNAVRVPLGGQALQPKITTLLHVWAIRCASADNRTDSRCLARSPLVAHKAARVAPSRTHRGSSCALSRLIPLGRAADGPPRALLGRV